SIKTCDTSRSLGIVHHCHLSKGPGHMSARSTQKRFKRLKFLWGAIDVVVVVGFALGGFMTWSVLRAFPDTSGRLDAARLDHDVTVQRHAQALPKIIAATLHALLYTKCLIHAQARFWIMASRRPMNSARLFEPFGSSQLDTDKFLRASDSFSI